jgi:hypothetical protein
MKPSRMGAIPESQNPDKALASYARDLDIVVFNGVPRRLSRALHAIFGCSLSARWWGAPSS